MRSSIVPAIERDSYDAAVVALTLRHVLMEATGAYIGAADMAFARLQTEEDANRLLHAASTMLEDKLDQLEQALGGLPAFFLLFAEPSFNYLGALIDPYAPTAPRAVIRELNRRFAGMIAARPTFHAMDVNDLLNAVGRMHLQGDVITSTSHASFISEALMDLDLERFVPPAPNADEFNYTQVMPAYGELFVRWLEQAMAVLRQGDPVKLIIVDLDDTLWRGVAADGSLEPWARVEGWPVGVVEALLYFKRRGGLLVICSKNDRVATLHRLPAIWHGAIREEDFAAMRINWHSKAENIAEILAETNILPQHALFIDDNPRELDEVVARVAGLRVLGGRAQGWRRILLTAPELQVPVITEESVARTHLMQARAARDAGALHMTREAWLASLELHAEIRRISNPAAPAAARALELLNKTNQFNTSGERWSVGDLAAFLQHGVCLALRLRDRHADNGLVGVALVRDGQIIQVILSCRVFGLGAEIALGSTATRLALRQRPVAKGRIIDTGRNFTCHAYFTSLGFEQDEAGFRTDSACGVPPWLHVTFADKDVPAV